MRRESHKLIPELMQAKSKPFASKVIAMMMTITPALAASDAVETYKARSPAWSAVMDVVRVLEMVHDYCGLAQVYDRLEVYVRHEIKRRKVTVLNNGAVETYPISDDDARRLEDFADNIGLDKRAAERQCKR